MAQGQKSGPRALMLCQDATDYFTWLAREGLEREHSHVWDNLASACADIEAVGAFAELRRAYDEGLIDPGFMGPNELDSVENGPRGKWLARFREHNRPLIDVAAATGWWQCFHDDPEVKAKTERSEQSIEPLLPDPICSQPTPYRAPRKVGRNDPCPCGSGEKYKKCCGQ